MGVLRSGVMNRTRLVLLGLVLSIWSCSGPVAERIADAMVDAAGAVRDAAGADAAAQLTLDIDCAENVYTTRATSSGATATSSRSTWIASVTVPGLDPQRVTRAFAVICGLERFGPAAGCPVDASGVVYTCTGTPPYSDDLDCQVAEVEVEAGRARVYCGSRVQSISGMSVVDSGLTRHHAHFVIESAP